jgi:predicted Zn-dependent protease
MTTDNMIITFTARIEAVETHQTKTGKSFEKIAAVRSYERKGEQIEETIPVTVWSEQVGKLTTGDLAECRVRISARAWNDKHYLDATLIGCKVIEAAASDPAPGDPASEPAQPAPGETVNEPALPF